MSFQFILSCFYFFLPAYFTNMTPPLIRKAGLFASLGSPVDFGRKFLGQPILGSHKTWRGVIFGIISGILITGLQGWLYQFPLIKKISFINYQEINILLFAFLISAGAVFGDLSFAFIKRRLKLKPGTRFLPFAQTNYVCGVALFLPAFSKISMLKISILAWITILILTFFLHITFTWLGYLIGFYKNKW